MLDPLKEIEKRQPFTFEETEDDSFALPQAILENITDGILNLDAFGRITYMNNAAEKMLERPRTELLGMSVWTSFPTAVGTPLYDNYLASMATQRTHTFDFYYSAINKWFKFHAYPGKDLFTILFRDITIRKNNEKLRKESEQMYKMIADNSTDMISRVSTDGIYLYVSPASKTLLGYEPEELLGQNMYGLLHPEDFPNEGNASFKDSINSKTMLTEYRIRRKDGTYIWFETTARTILDPYGLRKEIISVSRDVSSRKHVEKQLLEANELLQKISTVDALTGVSNRRGFDEYLKKEWKQCSRMAVPLSLILIDIDYFKHYNDTYGHVEGDICLRLVAESLKKAAKRSIDFIARYGGEEFVIILPSTDASGAQTVAEHLRMQVEALQIPLTRSEGSSYITISLGTATMIPTRDSDPKELFLRADKALYQAKQEGRNLVRLYYGND